MTGLLPIALFFVGGYFFVRLRAFFVFHPIKAASALVLHCKEEGKGAFVRLSLALAGTLGVGNVTGVAIGILVGGAGSVFWLLLSALFAAPLKYAESVASLLHSGRGHGGGMLPVIEGSHPSAGKTLAVLYAILSVCLALVMGSGLQAAAVFEGMRETLGATVAYILLAFFVASLLFCIFGPRERIAEATARLIPIAMIMYSILCILTIFLNFSGLPRALRSVFDNAFSLRAAGGGAVGAMLRSPLHEGFMRGLLSNEAGAGTSAYAHADGRSAHTVSEGILGMLEVVFDTVILCMLTAFSILLSVEDPSAHESGMALLTAAFSSALGRAYAPFLLASVFLFALSTSVCWYEYGRIALSYLTYKKRALYFALYISFLLAGAFLGSGRLVPLCDAVFFFLCPISLYALIKSSAAVCAETDRVLLLPKKRSLGRTRRHQG